MTHGLGVPGAPGLNNHNALPGDIVLDGDEAGRRPTEASAVHERKKRGGLAQKPAPNVSTVGFDQFEYEPSLRFCLGDECVHKKRLGRNPGRMKSTPTTSSVRSNNSVTEPQSALWLSRKGTPRNVWLPASCCFTY